MHVGAAIRERGMAPKDVAAAGVFARFEQFRAADFFEALSLQASQDQFALVVPDPAAVALLDEESLAKQSFFTFARGTGFPQPVTGRKVEAAQLAKPAHAVNTVTVDHRRAHGSVKSLLELGLALAAPIPGDLRLRAREIEQERSLVEGGEKKLRPGQARHGDGYFGPLRFATDRIGMRPEHFA